MKMIFYSDGGARGNPGPAAYAVIACKEDGFILYEKAEAIGIATNNEAEYRGLIAGINMAVSYGAYEAEFVTDSELVVKQMAGVYRVKAANLKELRDDAMALAGDIKKVSFRHVKREDPMIVRADALLNAVLDGKSIHQV